MSSPQCPYPNYRDGRFQIKLAMYTVQYISTVDSTLSMWNLVYSTSGLDFYVTVCCFRSHSSRRRVERCLNYRDEWRSQSQFSNIKFYSPFRLSAPTGINTNFACNSVKNCLHVLVNKNHTPYNFASLSTTVNSTKKMYVFYVLCLIHYTVQCTGLLK